MKELKVRDLKKILENNDLAEYAINGLEYFDDEND